MLTNLINFLKKALFAFLLFCSSFIESQNNVQSPKDLSTWQAFKYDMGSVGKGIGHSYSRPAHWKGKQWLNFTGVVTGTALLTLVDDEFNHWSDGYRDEIPQGVLDFGGDSARPEGNYGLTGAVYFTGLFLKDEKLRRTGVLMMASTIAGGFLQQLTLRVISRARPLTDEPSNTFDTFLFKEVKNYDSFFSGHTILSFSNAYAIAKQFKNPWVKAGIYTVGMIPGFSRIVDGKHWLSDVALGTALSILIVESIDKYLETRYQQKYNDKAKKVDWDLSFAPRQIGLTLSFN